MAEIVGWTITPVLQFNDKAAETFIEYLLNKYKDTLTDEIVKRQRNLVVYGHTHPELLIFDDPTYEVKHG